MAARRLFAANPGSPMAAALIKEFGLYPPGCFVKLKSGETGVVVRYGMTALPRPQGPYPKDAAPAYH